jgi:hypothetical protein
MSKGPDIGFRRLRENVTPNGTMPRPARLMNLDRRA